MTCEFIRGEETQATGTILCGDGDRDWSRYKARKVEDSWPSPEVRREEEVFCPTGFKRIMALLTP